MARVGPNQDINDSTVVVLEDLRRIADEVSVLAAAHNNADNAVTENKYDFPLIDPANERLISVSTLLKKEDGTSVAIGGFTASGTSTSGNLSAYYESVINTHIDQPERFRDYYDTIVSTIDSWSNRDNGSTHTIARLIYQSGVQDWSPPSLEQQRGWAECEIETQQKDGYAAVSQLEIPGSIDWSGSGPTNYNSGTYPQLMSVFADLATILTEQNLPYITISEGFSFGYDRANDFYGFFKRVSLFERCYWNHLFNRFAQVSNVLPSQSDLDDPILIGPQHFFTIPVMVSNFSDVAQNIGFSVKVTMTPRNASNRIIESYTAGEINKRIFIIGHHGSDNNSIFIQHDTFNTSEMNDIITSSFELQFNDYILVHQRSLGVAEIKIAFVNQIRLFNTDTPDPNIWYTEDLLSDINIQISSDGHSIDQDFTVGLERDMWPYH